MYYVINDAMRVASVHDTVRKAMIAGNKMQAANPMGFGSVYCYAERHGLKVGDRVGNVRGWCVASADNYPDASPKLTRQ
ncbi:MAG: hypothetical protein AB1698_01480 [Pseudomonadota bacterium]